MNILKPQLNPQLNQSNRERRSRRPRFCAVVGLLAFLVSLISVTVVAEDAKTEEPPSTTGVVETQTTEANTGETDNTVKNRGTTKEEITGTSNKMERYEKEGITILIDEAKTVRYNEEGVEIGFLNADKITLKANTETGETMEIVAEGNVEIRDQDIFATCDHAVMNNLTNTITLKENVVVLQNKDRLETKLFTFNRTTGRQTGEGGVKFKVTVTQAAPVSPEGEAEAGTDTSTDEEETSSAAPQTTDVESGVEEKPEAADAGGTEAPDSGGEPDTDAETSEDADGDVETEESEESEVN